MANFTTWKALHTSLLDRLASRNFTMSSGEVSGQKVEWTNADELLRVIDYVKVRADLETGAVSRKVYARNGGRG